MYIDWQTIITLGGVASAVISMVALIIKAHNLVLELKSAKAEIREVKSELEERVSKLEQHHEDDVHRVNEEMCLICFGMSACLDGLQQLGANHEVPEAKKRLDKYLNQQAHG